MAIETPVGITHPQELSQIEVKVIAEFRSVAAKGWGTLTVTFQAGKVVNLETALTQDPRQLRMIQGDAGKVSSGY